MGVLDDLKREAKAAKAEKQEHTLSAEAVRELAERTVQPRIQKLFKYFKDLKAQLDVVDAGDVVRSYDIQGVGELKQLVQSNYKLNTDDVPQRVEQFAFHYECAKQGRREVRIAHRSTAAVLREYLWANNLKFTARDAGDSSIILSIENRVPVAFEFSADYDKPGVRLRVRNLSALGATVHMFRPMQVDEHFAEEVAKEILGRSSRFGEICGNKLTETTRVRLRDQVKEIEREREREVASSSAEPEKKRSLTSKLGRTLLRRKD